MTRALVLAASLLHGVVVSTALYAQDTPARLDDNSLRVSMRLEPGDDDHAVRLLAERTAGFEDLRQRSVHLETFAGTLRLVAKLVGPSVVHIEAEKEGQEPTTTAHEGDNPMPVEEAGSGVLLRLDDHLYVLTNRHVILSASTDRIRVKLADGRQLVPQRVLADSGSDIALLEVVAPGLVPARIGDSSKVDVGDFVLAFGSPFGLSRSVTFGIVSAKGRRDLELGNGPVVFQDFIQTDAAINPGNSGGPLLNLRGELIGLNTAIASNSGGSEGIGFAIPINLAMFVARQLNDQGYVSRAYLGVQLDGAFDAVRAGELGIPRKVGALVTGVTSGSPADQAGLRTGDVILRFNDVEVEDDGHLVNIVGQTEVNSEATMVIYRNRNGYRLTVRVGERRNESSSR
ncbi:MAG: trypsin-like peptidase domain-containing protein [Pirellulaceae bacterium]|nr:trypsin-like peptidase domain-containing protein [Planctomycetales bacterium]